MKRLTLTRYWYEPDRTIGELHCENQFVGFTMEPGSADLEYPRVPTGFYHLVRHDGAEFKYKDTWALEGRDVSHAPRVGMRSAVLFHPGNWDHQTQGCILIGLSIGRLNNETAVISSSDAMGRLREFLGKSEAYLTIKGGR